VLPVGESPIRAKVSHQPVTEFCMAGGNECHEARRKEISGRNASEGIEPRNVTEVLEVEIVKRCEDAIATTEMARV